MKKSKEEIEGLGNLYLINETREKVEDDIPDVYTQDDIIKAVAWGYDEGFYDATKWHYPSKGEYPIEDDLVLCLQSDGTIPFIGVYSNNKWFNWYTKFIYEFEPKCWQYIVPPKESV